MGTWDDDIKGSPPLDKLESKLLLLDPEGHVVWGSRKAIPVPGGEAAISALDDGRIKSADTRYGRLGSVICFDMDFPGLFEQAGRANVDIMLVPSNDWKEIDPWHSHMARVRAIEQGFNLVRHISNGLSVAADYQGRGLNSMDHGLFRSTLALFESAHSMLQNTWCTSRRWRLAGASLQLLSTSQQV